MAKVMLLEISNTMYQRTPHFWAPPYKNRRPSLMSCRVSHPPLIMMGNNRG